MNSRNCKTISTMIANCVKMAESVSVNFTIAFETGFGHKIWFASGGQLKQELMVGTLKQEEEDVIFTLPNKTKSKAETKVDFQSVTTVATVKEEVRSLPLPLDLRSKKSVIVKTDHGDENDTEGDYLLGMDEVHELEKSGEASSCDDVLDTLKSEDMKPFVVINKLNVSADFQCKVEVDKPQEDDSEYVENAVIKFLPGVDGRFHCLHCPQSYKHAYDLRKHFRKHTGEKPYKCSVCSKSFSQPSTLRQHHRTHTNEKPFKCPHCPKLFRQRQHLTGHVRIHTGERPFKCKECPKAFSLSCNLKSHILTHTGERPFKCDQCPKALTQLSALKTHLLTHKKIVPLIKEKKLHKCMHCDKSFKKACKLIVHTRTHTGERPFKCTFCPKTFADSSNLVKHNRTHTGEAPFKCSLCPLTFKQSPHLQSHLQKHTGERPFECSQCHKSFQNHHHLKSHLLCHREERPFHCPHGQCTKTFKASSELKVHIRSHTGEKPFECSICGKCFKVSSKLKRHIQTHKPVEEDQKPKVREEKPFECSICGKRFQAPSKLKRHLQTHVPLEENQKGITSTSFLDEDFFEASWESSDEDFTEASEHRDYGALNNGEDYRIVLSENGENGEEEEEEEIEQKYVDSTVENSIGDETDVRVVRHPGFPI